MTDDASLREARAAASAAREQQAEVRSQWPEILKLARTLRARREQNNFAAMIAAAMRGTP